MLRTWKVQWASVISRSLYPTVPAKFQSAFHTAARSCCLNISLNKMQQRSEQACSLCHHTFPALQPCLFTHDFSRSPPYWISWFLHFSAYRTLFMLLWLFIHLAPSACNSFSSLPNELLLILWVTVKTSPLMDEAIQKIMYSVLCPLTTHPRWLLLLTALCWLYTLYLLEYGTNHMGLYLFVFLPAFPTFPWIIKGKLCLVCLCYPHGWWRLGDA